MFQFGCTCISERVDRLLISRYSSHARWLIFNRLMHFLLVPKRNVRQAIAASLKVVIAPSGRGGCCTVVSHADQHQVLQHLGENGLFHFVLLGD